MNPQSWSSVWNGYQIKFQTQNLREAEDARISLEVFHGVGTALVAEGWFKLRREGYFDEVLSRWFDQIVISNISIDKKHQGAGLGKELIRAIARLFPQALIVGENPNDDAEAWHKRGLEPVLPTRMIRVDQGVELRVTPGIEIDQAEL